MSLIDLHSHLVPGVDDGAGDVGQSVQALERLAAAGVVAAITTPHFHGSLTLTPSRQELRLAELDRAWGLLQSAPGRPDVELFRGVELLLDVPDPKVDDPRLRLNGGPFVLVEFPYMMVPPGSARVLEKLRTDGWQPILAHPERYEGQDAGLNDARGWRAAGACLQLNGPAVLGRYGETARRRAFALLEAGLVDYLGSDYHSRGEPRIAEYRAALEDRETGEMLELLTETNPKRLLEGLPPLPVPPFSPRPSWLSRLLRK
jgi:protein-tyrosine phosphatase